MENYIYVERLDGPAVWVNTNHIMYLSTKSNNDTFESYFIIHLTNGETLQTSQNFAEITNVNFQDYINGLSNKA